MGSGGDDVEEPVDRGCLLEGVEGSKWSVEQQYGTAVDGRPGGNVAEGSSFLGEGARGDHVVESVHQQLEGSGPWLLWALGAGSVRNAVRNRPGSVRAKSR